MPTSRRAHQHRPVAKRPPARTVLVELKGDFAGWACTARADFPAGILADLQSSSVDRVVRAMAAIVLEHNFPGADDELAGSMRDVDPFDGLIAAGVAIIQAIGALPNR